MRETFRQISGLPTPVAGQRWLVLALALAGCVNGATPSTSTTTATTNPVTAATETVSGFDGMSLSAPCGTAANPTNLGAIEAVDQHTVVFTLCSPDGAFPVKAAFPSMAIQPAEHLQSTAGSPLRQPVGTGPYRLIDWKTGDEIVMERFEGYWGDPALTETIVFRWLADATQRLEAIESGAVDGFAVSDEDLSEIADQGEFDRFDQRDLNVLYLGLNRDIAPLNDDRVRAAIAMAIDKQAIVEELFPAGSVAADQFLPPELFGYANGLASHQYDPEKARALLIEAGADGLELALSYRDTPSRYLPDPAGVANAIRANLAEVGIFVSLTEMASGEFLDAVDTGELPLYLLGWEATYPDPTDFLDFHFGAEASEQFGNHFVDVEEILAEAAAIADQPGRLDLYSQAAVLLDRYVPAVPIAHSGSEMAYLPDVEGAHASLLGTESFARVSADGRDSLVWMQANEPGSLYCADESDRDSFRACSQMLETLVAYDPDGNGLVQNLAETYSGDADGTVWTFNMRRGVEFHDGSELDANDVVASFAAQWDSTSPIHTGRTGDFVYFAILFGGFLNTPNG